MDKGEQFGRFHKSWTEINAAYERYAREIGVSYSLLQVLCELYNAKGLLTQKELCEACHLPKTTVHAIVNGLAGQGQIELHEMPKDRRQKGISLTDAGREYAMPIMERMEGSEQRAFDMLGEETIRMMLKGIEEYQKYFNEYLNGGE